MPDLSVIVVNWNGKHFLETCLKALSNQTFRDFETILVDNASEDRSVEYVKAEFPRVRVIELQENRGFCGGNIAGYEHASGELIALLNNDTEAHPKWLEELHKASLEYSQAGSFACKMLLFDEREQIDICGFGMTKAGVAVDFGRGEPDGRRWDTPREVFGACAGAAAYRRRMLDDIGFFDEDFFGTYEDLDLSFRAQLRGYAC
ncbi:MAG TPA: glycosyltransferase family 2 protein, partial [Candidatus Acidoferrum sp.]